MKWNIEWSFEMMAVSHLFRCRLQTSSISQQIQIDMMFNTDLDPLVVVFWHWSFECVTSSVRFNDAFTLSRWCRFRVWWPFNPPWILSHPGIVYSFGTPFFKPLCFSLLFVFCCFLFVSCISFHAFCRHPWDETWAPRHTQWINFEDSTQVSGVGFLPGRAGHCQ